VIALIRGASVLTPGGGELEIRDVRIADGRIAEIGASLDAGGGEVIEARGRLLLPGFVDLHAHLREPGFEYKESIRTGSAAAAAGGFTAVCAMANTDPVNDNRSVTRWIVDRSRETGGARVHPIGAITRSLAGAAIAEFGEMKDAGAVAVSDDGHWVADGSVMRAALEYSRLFDLPVATHSEDRTLSRGAAMNEGAVATRLGLSAQPAEAEHTAIGRDLDLARLTGARLHVCHVSTARGLDRIREARRQGVRVTCEATPHHLLLTDAEVLRSGFSTHTKVNPPLRAPGDVEALVAGLADGTIDAIATDHAPHHEDEKAVDFESAPFGIAGLETAAALVHTRLVRTGVISLAKMVDLLSAGPCRAFSLPGGRIEQGADADLTLFDPEAEWTVLPSEFLSRARNTPFAGWRLTGRVDATLVAGRIVFRRA
jgi:dihydroorotase